MMIENVSSELRKYLEGKPVLSTLLGLGMYILYASAALILFDSIVYLGGFINGFITYLFYLGIVLCLASLNFQALMIGFAAGAVEAIIRLFQGFFWEFGFYINWHALFTLLIFGFFAYLAYKKAFKKA